MTDFNRFEVSHHGITYISEFDFEALKKADELKVMDMTGSPVSFTFLVFYCSVLKNNPYANQRRVREFFDEVVQDEEYGMEAFTEITEEFINHFLEFVAPKKKKKTKKFTTVSPAAEVVNFQKADE